MTENQTEVKKVDVATLRSQLTKKNEQYILQLERSLKEAQVSKSKIASTLEEMLPVLVEKQKKGLTARQLFGTVTQQTQSVLEGPKKDPTVKSPDWQIAVDGGLMVGGFFALIAGITLFLNPEQSEAMGVISLIMNFIVGGLALLALYKVTPDINQPKGKRGYIRYLVVSSLVMLAWLVIVMGTQLLIPASINYVFPAIVYLFIGSGSLVLKWYLKKTLDIRGGIL